MENSIQTRTYLTVVQNCIHEKHDGPSWKEFTDGDGKALMIEVCRTYRGKNV